MDASLWRRALLLAVVFSGVANLLMLVPTLYMLQVYDRVLISRNLGTLAAVSLIAVYLFAMMAFAEWARSNVLARLGGALESSLAPRVFAANFAARLRATADLPNRVFADLTELRQFLASGGATAVLDLPWSPVYLGVLFLLHPWLGLSALLFAMVQLAVAVVTHLNVLKPAMALSQLQAQESTFIQGHLRSVEAAHVMGMTPAITARVMRLHGTFNEAHGQVVSLTQRQAAISRFVRYLQQSLILAVGALLVIDSQISAASMIAANILMNRALSPIDTIVATWRAVLSARQARLRLLAFLAAHEPGAIQTSPAQSNPQQPRRAAMIGPDVALQGLAPQDLAVHVRNLVARAPSRDAPILKGLDFEAPPGSITLVMGPSGSGKSTLMRALAGAWPDLEGEVLIAGEPIEATTDARRAALIGSVPQDTELFEGSIAENISRFASPSQATAQAVIEAARACGLHELILRLPAGYDTPLGSLGSGLSAGQRQRIALARALYGNPPVLILDEPNANLDDLGETALVQALRSRREQGATVFLVSHNPLMKAIADRVLILSDGRITSLQPVPPSTAPRLQPAAQPPMPQP